MFDAIFPKEWTTLQRLMWLKTNALARAVYETITGNPVSFTAKAAPLRQLSVAFSPVQNLNGYDNPWPAGGGVNKLPISEAFSVTQDGITFSSDGNGKYQIFGTSTRSTGYSFDIPETIMPATAYVHLLNKEASGYCAFAFISGNTQVFSLALGVVNRIYDATAQLGGQTINKFRLYVHEVQTVNVTLTPMVMETSTVTAYSPYSNICPISGRDSVTVNRTGVNVWDGTYTADHVVRSTDGEIEPSASTWCASNYIPVKGGLSYYLNDFSTQYAGVCGIAWYDKDKTYISGVSAPQNQNYGVQTAPENAAFLRVTIESAKIAETSINYPATDTEYHAYSGNEYTIQLGETVYSGYVDVVTGAGEVTMASVDLGSFNWKAGNRNNEDTGRVFYVTGLPVGSTNSLCSIYKQGTQSLEDMHVNNYYLSATGAFMVCADYANKTDFATAVTGQTLCYELATPIPLQLTPQEVQSLLGVNNMWSDANGDLTVEYRSN